MKYGTECKTITQIKEELMSMSEWIQAGVGIGQLLITGGLLWITYSAVQQMRRASTQRDRQLDDQHAALMELLKRSEP